VYAKLADDRSHAIKAVCVVHNETSTGVVSRIGEIRKQIDAARHPALLLVDTISRSDRSSTATMRGAWT
jgi:alanine-glyoxylate transaminase/serine-glyoxylate transaminase/serine-pyruvate transaminase